MASVARQATFNFLLTYAGLILGFLNVAILYPKVLPEDQFGLTRLLVSLATMVGAFAQMGLDNTVIRYFPYFRDKSGVHRGLFTLAVWGSLAGCGLAGLALFALHPYLSGVFADDAALYASYGLWAVPLVIAEVFFLALRGYSRALKRSVQPTFIREFVLRVLQTGLIAAQCFFELPFSSFVVLFSATFAVCSGWLFLDLLAIGERVRSLSTLRVPRRLRSSMVRYAVFTLATSVTSVVLGSVDQLMIGALLGKHALREVGFYAVAFSFGAVVSAPMRALAQLVFPMLADAWKVRDHSSIERLYQRSSTTQFSVGAFLFLLVWANLGSLFTFMDPTYAGTYSTTIVVCATALMNMAVGVNTGIIIMSRHYRVDSITSALLLALNVVLNWFFIRRWGIEGAAWSSFVSLAVVLAIRVVYLKRKFDLWPFTWRTLLVPALIIGIGWPLKWLPSTGTILLDMVIVSALITLTYWPLVHWARVAPDITDRGLAYLRTKAGRA